MENIVINIISIVLQSVVCGYFLISFCKLITKDNYAKNQLFIHFIIILISTIVGTVTKNTIPFLNTLLTWLIIFLDLKFLLKVPFFKSILSILAIYITLIITELTVFFICRQIYNITSEELFNSSRLLFLVILIQMTLILLITQFTKINKIKNIDFKKIFFSY